jgi:hypothetical protein
MRALAVGHGSYYLLTGLWPVVGIGSFQAVTGDKTDLWLVKTVGLLIAAVGASILVSGRRQEPGVETVVLAAGSALALGTIDVYYTLAGVISKVYLLDAPVEAALAAAWIAFQARRRRLAPALNSPYH